MESSLPAPPQLSSDQASLLPQIDTRTAPPDRPSPCLELRNAMEESLVRLRKDLKIFQQRQEAWFRCEHGEDLFGDSVFEQKINPVAVELRSGLIRANEGLSKIANATGIEFNGD